MRNDDSILLHNVFKMCSDTVNKMFLNGIFFIELYFFQIDRILVKKQKI